MAEANQDKPVRKDAARNRAVLIESADSLYRRRGKDLTLDEVARHAGVGVATAYRHFESKQALMAALFADRIARAEVILREALLTEDPREGLERCLYGIGEKQAQDRGLRDSLVGDHGLRNAEEVRGRLVPLIEQIFDRARAAGLLRVEVSHLDMPVIVWIVGAVADYGGSHAPDLWRRYLDLLLDGMLAEGVARRPVAARPLQAAELDQIISTMVNESPRPNNSG